MFTSSLTLSAGTVNLAGGRGLRLSRLLLRAQAEKKQQLGWLGDSRLSNAHPRQEAWRGGPPSWPPRGYP